jgi:transaldolase
MVNRTLGYSLWLDFVERTFLQEGFPKLIKEGIINGATSNPAIFASAIHTSPAYKEQLHTLEGLSAKEKYEALAIEDIRTAAQALRANYDEGDDGYISLEVDPFLSNDTEGTIAEGQRLFKTIGEPNVMIKVPATEAGYEAMRVLLSMGVSVNATLIFSPKQAQKCIDAMKQGLTTFENSGGGRCNAVISIFVSRFDRLLDTQLQEKGLALAKTGIYNAAKIYNLIEEANVPSVRTLFASTGVKGDDLPPAYYMQGLYGAHAINTAPLTTIQAFQNDTPPKETLPINATLIETHFEKLAQSGIHMDEVYQKLLHDGLVAFEDAFSAMLEGLA